MRPLLLALLASLFAAPLSAQRTFVLVHGAWGGSWSFQRVDSLLSAAGHRVIRPSLTGLGERVHLAGPSVALGTHVADVVNAIAFEGLRDVVLVGHSYGGMVVAGVAERIPERIRHVVYLDAVVPEDGESMATAVRGTRLAPMIERMLAADSAGLLVPPWVSPGDPLPHDVPQPTRTFTEPLAVRNAASRAVPATYILTVAPGVAEGDDAFAPFAARARARGWTNHVLPADHSPQQSAPDALVELLLRVP